MLRGNPTKYYVYGIDPASEVDRFSIVVLEINEFHSRVVYAWSTTKKEFRQQRSLGQTHEHDFYSFVRED